MQIYERIKSRLKQVHDWSSVINELEAEGDQLGDAGSQSAFLFSLAGSCEGDLLDKSRAMEIYNKAFKTDQTNLSALQHAREIFHEMAALEMVERLMGIELRSNQDAARAPQLNYAYGITKLNQRDIATAKQFLDAALGAEPGNAEYQARVAEVSYDRANWAAEFDALVAQIAGLVGEADPLAAAVQNKGAEVSALYLRCARMLQIEAPADERLLPFVFKALDANPMNQSAGFLSELMLAAGEHYGHLQKLMDRRASLVEDEGVRVALLSTFAQTWQVRFQNAEMAAYFYRQALELAFGHEVSGKWHVAAYRYVKAQAVAAGNFDGIVALGQRGLDKLGDSDEGILLAIEVGEVAWRHADDLNIARAMLSMAHAAAPEHPVITEFQSAHGAFDDAGAEAPQEEAVDDGAAEAAAAEAAAAEAAAAEAAAAEAAAAEAAAAEAAAAEAAAAEAAAAEAAAAEAAAAEAATPVTLGDEEFTGEEKQIIEAAEAAAAKGGKRAIDAWRDAVSKLPDRTYPRERLKALYIESNKWSNVADLYKDQIKRSTDDRAKVGLYEELINIYRERLKQPGLIVTTLAQLEKLLESLDDTEALLKVVEQQQAQFESMKRWPDLIGRIRRRAEITDDVSAKVSLHLEAGELFLEKFNNQAEAIKSYEAVLEADDLNATAINKLKELYGRRRDWEKMLAVQQKELSLIEDPEERQAQMLEVARTAGQKVKKPALSIQLWTAVLEGDPSNLEALHTLESLQERDKNWEALAKTLELLIEVETDETKKTAQLVKLGLLYADKLHQNADAIRVWETLHEVDPNNRRAQDALKKLYLAEGNVDALEAFYAKQEKWGEFVRVLEREVDSAAVETKVELLLKVAELYEQRLGKADKATRALEKALGADDANLRVAERLIGLYEAAGDEKNISPSLVIKLDNTEDPEERKGLLLRLADLGERVLQDGALAFSYYRRALDENHDLVEAGEHMRRLAEGTGLWTELVAAFEKATETYGPSTESLPLRLTVAMVYEQHLQDLEKALSVNEAILEIDAEQHEALASLERLYIALGREADLLEVLTTKLSLAESDDDKRQIQGRIGSIHEQLGNVEKAIESYSAVLASGVEDLGVLQALDRIYLGLEKWSDLADALRRQLAVIGEEGDPQSRLELTYRLGVVCQDNLNEADEAVDAIRFVLSLSPTHDDSRRRMEFFLASEDHKVVAAEVLLPVYEAAEAWESMVQCLQIQAAAATDETTRVNVLLRVGAIQAQAMGDTAGAMKVYANAFQADPQNESARDALENLVSVEGAWEMFAELLEDATSKDLPVQLLTDLLSKLALTYDTRLSQPEKAIAAWQRASEVDSSNVAPLDALDALYQRAERWAELLEVYTRKVSICEDGEMRQHIRFQIAYLQEEMLQQRAEAIATYNEILADEEQNVKAIVALDRLYLASESWPELAEILEREISLAGDANEQIALSLRLGAVRLEKLDHAEAAVGIFQQVLTIDPGNATAIGALESLLTNDEQQLAVAKILEPIYRATNQVSNLTATLEIMVSKSLDPSEKLALLHQIAELCEISGEQQQAFSALGRALKEDPSSVETQQRLDTLASHMGAFEELVGLYEESTADVVDEQLMVALLQKIAQIYETTLANLEKAAATYERILDVNPSSFEAIDALIQLYNRAQNFDALVKAVVRKSEMVESPDDRKALLAYAANVRETVSEDTAAAVELYQQVLAIDDTDAAALDALEKLYIRLENWESLKDIYTRKTELTTDPDERRKVLRVLGQVYDAELKDIDRAIDTYQAILDIDPNDFDAITALDRLFGTAERWHDQLTIIQRALELTERHEAQTELRHRVGHLWETELADPTRAVESYREVLSIDPNHAATLTALDRIVHGDVEPMAAAVVLEPFYEQLAEWEKLIDLYQVMVSHTADPNAQIERLHMTAGIQERHLQDLDAAFASYAAAMEIDPQNQTTVGQLGRIADATGDWERVAALMASEAEKVLDPEIKAGMLKQVAVIRLEKLQDVEKAISRYQEIVEDNPEDADAIGALDHIFTRLERWDDLIDVLRRQISVTPDETQSVELQFRVGQVYHINLNNLAEAVNVYRDILAIAPEHQPSIQAMELIFAEGEMQSAIAEVLEPLHYAAQRWDQIVKIGEVKLSITEDRSDRFDIIRNVAEIAENKLGDTGNAYVWWLRAYIDDPSSEDVATEVERLAEVTGHWSYIVDVSRQILESEDELAPETRQAVLLREGRTLETRLGDMAGAVHAFQKVLEIDAEQSDALVALDRLYAAAGEANALAEILQRRLQVEMSSDVLVELEMRLGQVFETGLGQAEHAVAAYNRALEHDPGNRDALTRLEMLYLNGQRWEELFDIYQKLVDIVNTDEDMADAYQRMAKLAADCLGRETDAVDLWGRVLDLRGEDALALYELAGLHERAERWDELVEVLERSVYVAEEPQQRIAIFQMMGRIYGDNLDRDRESLEAWLNALEIDGENLTTLEALERIYRNNQSWVELVDTLRRILALGYEVLGTERMRDLFAQAGMIQAEYLMQTDDAISAWRQVLSLVPGDTEALMALEQLFRQQANWPEVIDVLEKRTQAEGIEKEERIELLLQIASIYEGNLENKLQAAAAYEEIIESDPLNGPAADALEAILRENEDWEELVQLFFTRAEASDEADDQEEKVRSLQRAALVAEQDAGDLDTAYAFLQAAFEVDFSNEETAVAIERIATAANKWDELLEQYTEMVEQTENETERCELWVKIGRWYGDHLDNPEKGIDALQRALNINDENVNALRELANFYERRGEVERLAETLTRSVPLEQDPEVQARTLLRLAEVQETGLAQVAPAIESYRRALELEDDNAKALDALARLHEQEGQWSDFVSVLTQRVQTLEDMDAALVLRKRIGQVQASELGDAAAAIETYKDIIATEPTDRDALHALERLYLDGGSVEDYLETLESELDATADVEEQLAIYDRMVGVTLEQAEDPERAADMLEKMIMLDPTRAESYSRLEEIYRNLERWSEFTETCRSHVEALEDAGEKIAVLLDLGQVCEKEIEDVDRAIDTFREILELDEDHFEAANSLSRLQEQIEDWMGAVETMARLVELNRDPEARIDLLTRMGRIYFEKLEDQEAAELRLNDALAIDPEYVPALDVLANLYKARMDWLKAARTLKTASQAAANNFEKTRFGAESGTIFLEELGDRDAALEMYALVMEVDPEHLEVGYRLSAMYVEDERFDAALPIYEMLARKAAQLEQSDDDLLEMYINGAKCALAMSASERALELYRSAYEIDSTSRDVLFGLADVNYHSGDRERAFKLYQTILVQHRDTQSDEDTVLVYHRLGAIKKDEGEDRKALNYFEKALEVDPNARETLSEVIELHEKSEDWEGVIEAKRALTDVADGDEQFTLFNEIGDLYSKNLGNIKKASEALHRALDLRPTDYPLLHKLLELFTKGKEWEDAISIIDRIVEIEERPKRRSKYNYTAAVLLRDNLNDHDEAIDRFNVTLDDDPSMLKAFEAIATMVTPTKDWKTLERNYRKMLKRLPGTGAEGLQLKLWEDLGEIYRSRLNDFKSAAAAFEIAAKLDPGQVKFNVVLAELYDRLVQHDAAEFGPKAVRAHQVLIAKEPFRVDSYRALFQIYQQMGAKDKAFSVAAALVFLKKANADEQAVFDASRVEGFVRARQRLSESVLQRHVLHPQQNVHLTNILGLFAAPLAVTYAKEIPSTIDQSSRVDITVDVSLFSQVANYVRDVVQVTQPDVYQRPKDPGDLLLRNFKGASDRPQPAMIVFGGLLRGRTEQHLAFSLGRHMMDIWFPHYAYVALGRSPEELKKVLTAALVIAGKVPNKDREIDALAKSMARYLDPAKMEMLKATVDRFIDAGGALDVKQWASAAELSCYRVGLLLCGDLAIAAQMVSQEQQQLGAMLSAKDKIKELLLYSISEDFFEARRALGLAVK